MLIATLLHFVYYNTIKLYFRIELSYVVSEKELCYHYLYIYVA